MSTLEVQIEGGRAAFVPGERVTGKARWGLDKLAKNIELRLFWYTEGLGTQDVGVVQTERIDAPAEVGDRDFAFILPQGPWSFSGHLISLLWAIEVVVLPSQESQRVGFVLGPAGQEVDLGVLTVEAKA